LALLSPERCALLDEAQVLSPTHCSLENAQLLSVEEPSFGSPQHYRTSEKGRNMMEAYLIGFLFIFVGVTMLIRSSWKEILAYTVVGSVGFVVTVILVTVLFAIMFFAG